MKKRFYKWNLLAILYLILSSWQCTENPIETNLSHLSLKIDTLSIKIESAMTYRVAPSLGANERLYLGMKNEIQIPISFIGINESLYWNYYLDSTIVFDSLHFLLYSDDSTLTQSSTPILYFHSDSQFSESKSTYLDLEGFSVADWIDLGPPVVKVLNDTSGSFTQTELKWDIMSLVEILTDTADSNLIRSFAIQLINSDTNFIELFSREASSGSSDPKVKGYYHQIIEIDQDSTSSDTSDFTIYSFGDISVFNSINVNHDTNKISLSNGLGLRSIFSIDFDSTSIPDGALIRRANLKIPVDTQLSFHDFKIVVDPTETDFDTSNMIFESDPFHGIGYPYRVSSLVDDGLFTISLKGFFQNVALGNEDNFGFKIISDEKNNPFDLIHFKLRDDIKPILELIYAFD